MPAAHCVQVPVAAIPVPVEYVPATQERQLANAVAPAPEMLYVPAAQLVQVAAAEAPTTAE